MKWIKCSIDLFLLFFLYTQSLQAQDRNIEDYPMIYSNSEISPEHFIFARYNIAYKSADDTADIIAQFYIKNVFTGSVEREFSFSFTRLLHPTSRYDFRTVFTFKNVIYSPKYKKAILIQELDSAWSIHIVNLLDNTRDSAKFNKSYPFSDNFFVADKFLIVSSMGSANNKIFEFSGRLAQKRSFRLSIPSYIKSSYLQPKIASILFDDQNKSLFAVAYCDCENSNYIIYRNRDLKADLWDIIDTASSKAVAYGTNRKCIYYLKFIDSAYNLWRYDIGKNETKQMLTNFENGTYTIYSIDQVTDESNFVYDYSIKSKQAINGKEFFSESNGGLVHLNIRSRNKNQIPNTYSGIKRSALYIRVDTIYFPEIVPTLFADIMRVKTEKKDSIYKYAVNSKILAGSKIPEIKIKGTTADTIYYSDSEKFKTIQGEIVDSLTPLTRLYINNKISATNSGKLLYVADIDKEPKITIECLDDQDNYNRKELYLIRRDNNFSQAGFTTLMTLSKSIALIIAEKDYENKADSLSNTINEAARLKDILLSKYNFNERNIYFRNDLKRGQVIKALDSISRNAGEFDQVLIFYTGHGIYDSTVDRGFWIPVDGTKGDQTNWYSNDDLLGAIKKIQAKHLFLLVDACYSGSVFEKKTKDPQDQLLAFASLFTRKSRQALTSGALEKVPDKSKFMEAVLKQLESNTKQYYSASDLYNDIKYFVLSNTHTSPQYGILINTGSEGGEFFFIKK